MACVNYANQRKSIKFLFGITREVNLSLDFSLPSSLENNFFFSYHFPFGSQHENKLKAKSQNNSIQ